MTVDELAAYNVVRMDSAEMDAFLSTHDVGVLGLPTEDAPSMRPMSYMYDGEAGLYLLYFLGSESRKAALSDLAADARFLVYTTESAFSWRSLLLTGHIDEVPADDLRTIQDAVEEVWRPDVLDKALAEEEVTVYQFIITERSGIKSVGLPPEFESDSTPDGA
jgi:nitroimidazol reductase NimA-like FMN-containing flavoprotein (pyridoxamine 5'-phosphate oxidase superfamily)